MMRYLRTFLLVLMASVVWLEAPSRAGSIVDEFPGLKRYRFRETDSELCLGFGVSPITILANRIMFTANIFQVQYLHRNWDLEIFSVSFGIASGKGSDTNSRHFIFRTIPKYRITDFLSIGLLAGLEFVSFPDLQARFYQGNKFSPWEQFSNSGLIYGVALSETFKFTDDYRLKLNQLVYQQTYQTQRTINGWTYNFQDQAIQNDRTAIAPSLVFMLEVSMLY